MKKLTAIIGLVIVATLALTGCVQQNTTSHPNHSGVSTAKPTAAPAPDAKGQLAQAQKLFPTATKLGKYSQSDVQLALYTSYMYSAAAFSNPYFIDGQFAKDDFPEANFQQNLGQFYSPNGYSPFFEAMKNIQSGTSDQRLAGIEFLTRNVYVISLAGSTYHSPVGCDKGTVPCLASGPTSSAMKYDLDGNGRIRVSFTVDVTGKYFDANNVEKDVHRVYDIHLFLVPNPNILQSTDYEFVIDESDNGVKSS